MQGNQESEDKVYRFKYPISNSAGLSEIEIRDTITQPSLYWSWLDAKSSKYWVWACRTITLYTTKYGKIVYDIAGPYKIYTDFDSHHTITFSKNNTSLSFIDSNEPILEYKGSFYGQGYRRLIQNYVSEFGNFDHTINLTSLAPWFTDAAKLPRSSNIPNDLAIDSLRKTDIAARIFLRNYMKDNTIQLNNIDELSFDNIAGIKALNKYYAALNKRMDSARDFGLLNRHVQNQPILNDKQLLSLSNKLAGEAGEELVDRAVKIDNKKLHNVILDYNYGNKRNTSANNQIDNIFITHTGIYCVEVKTRNIKTGYFDMQDLVNQGIKDQIGYHKDAVLSVLRDPDNHLKEILPDNLSSLIYDVVVIINRKRRDFQIVNADELTKFGAHIFKLEDLNLAMTNGLKENIYLTDEQIDKIAKVIKEKNAGIKGERLYPDNILFYDDARKGNSFTLNKDKIVNELIELENAIPSTINDDLLTQAIQKENKEELRSEKQREILEAINMLNDPVISNIYNHWYTYGYMDDIKNPLHLPDITYTKIQAFQNEFAKMSQQLEGTYDDIETRNAPQREIDERERKIHERQAAERVRREEKLIKERAKEEAAQAAAEEQEINRRIADAYKTKPSGCAITIVLLIILYIFFKIINPSL